MRLVDVLGIRRDREVVEPHERALARHEIGDLDPVLGFFGTLLRLDDVAGITDREADIAVGERVDVLGRVVLLDVAANLEQSLAGAVQILRLLRIRVDAEIVQDAGEEVSGESST
jgi:hypothetical protein